MSKREDRRALGRAIATGSKAEMGAALDRIIEPRNQVWERLSDMALGWVADAIIDGRSELVEGLKEAMDGVPE